jgi:hypothetical protein
MSAYRGTLAYPLTSAIRDTIAEHGLSWALRFYAKRLQPWELRVLFRSAYLR